MPTLVSACHQRSAGFSRRALAPAVRDLARRKELVAIACAAGGGEKMPKPPVKTLRSGAVKALLWENESGTGRAFHSVTLSRIYKDGEEWRETGSFRVDDLLDLALVAQRLYQWLKLKES